MLKQRCHMHVLLNDASGTLSATLFSTTAEKLIGYTAAELVEAVEKNAPLDDLIANKIDKSSVDSVVCFLKDYDRSYDSRFERTFPVVKLYVQPKTSAEKIATPSTLDVDTHATALQSCAQAAAEKEKQMFSPSTKGVIDELASEIGVDKGLSVANTMGKRGIVFGDSSDDEGILASKKIGTPTCEVGIAAAGSESPVKKLKNVLGHD